MYIHLRWYDTITSIIVLFVIYNYSIHRSKFKIWIGEIFIYRICKPRFFLIFQESFLLYIYIYIFSFDYSNRPWSSSTNDENEKRIATIRSIKLARGKYQSEIGIYYLKILLNRELRIHLSFPILSPSHRRGWQAFLLSTRESSLDQKNLLLVKFVRPFC